MSNAAKRPAEQHDESDERANKTIAIPGNSELSRPDVADTGEDDVDMGMSGFEQFLRDTPEDELSEFADTLKNFGVMSLNAVLSSVKCILHLESRKCAHSLV